MSVYVGIDVHRKRSQVAVLDQAGEVLANRNVPNGVETILGVIGDLPIGTSVAFEAAFGWGWLVELLEDYGFDPHLVHPSRCKAIASARLKNDLLTELSGRSFERYVRGGAGLARFAPRDQRRGRAAGVVRAGGAAAGVARGDRGSVPAVPAR
jgi:hypothetical protein